jgi:hypothetical protein
LWFSDNIIWLDDFDYNLTTVIFKFLCGFQINLIGEMSLIDTNASKAVDQIYVQQIPSLRGAQVSSFNRLPRNMHYYWSLPREFLSERVSGRIFIQITCLLL